MMIKGIVLVWVLYFPSPGNAYLFHGGEYTTRDSCTRAAQEIIEYTDTPTASIFECWPVRKVMQE